MGGEDGERDLRPPPGYMTGAVVAEGLTVGSGVGFLYPPGYMIGREGMPVGSGVGFLYPPGYMIGREGMPVGSGVGFLYPPGYIRGRTLGTEEDSTEGEDAGLSTDGSVGVARAEWCLEEECSAFLINLDEECSAALFFFEDLDDELFRRRSSIIFSSRAVHDSDH